MHADAYTMLIISDTGEGMTADIIPHIFEPFFTTKEQGKGTGLGLSTIYGIVKFSKGHIEVESKPQQGSTFNIYFPQAETGAKSATPYPPTSAKASGSETILLVEDEEMVQDLVYRTLKMDGYTILKASEGKEAIELCKQHQSVIHLLLTDVIMPGGISGPQLAEELLKLHPDMKILYMSGYTDDAIVYHGVTNSDTAFLQKPFTPNTLSRKVREVLDAI